MSRRIPFYLAIACLGLVTCVSVRVMCQPSGPHLRATLHPEDYVECVAFSPDGKTLASAPRTERTGEGKDGTIKLWDVASGKNTCIFKGHTKGVICVAFSPNGEMLASGSWDKTIKVWDVTSGKNTVTIQGDSEGVRSLSFSPDGTKLAYGGNDKTIKVWEVLSGKNTANLKGHPNPSARVCARPVSWSLDSPE